MTQRQVILEGGLPWGFRMHGGEDLKTPLKISRVNPGSKAAQRGIREGDFITSINGENTKNLTNNEAHNLLKNSSSTLTLGLNENTEGSPKRRQYRTIHQETHQETVKRSILSYSNKETVETFSSKKGNYNDFEAFKRNPNEFANGKDIRQNGSDIRVETNIPVSQKSTPSSSSTSTPSTLIPEGRNTVSDHAVASRQSSYSNCSSIPDEGLGSEDYPGGEDQEMNNEERASKSKKRRQRRKNNLLIRSLSQESEVTDLNSVMEEDVVEYKEEKINDTIAEPTNDRIEVLKLKRVEHKYRVESPKEVRVEHVKSSDKKLKAKSKSLDDDEILRIQELSEASESEDGKIQSNVVISEASSEENLIEDLDSDVQQKKRKALDSISLQLNDKNQIEVLPGISPAEEEALRTFLGGLNLVDSPEDSAKEVFERSAGLTDPKVKKQQKRKELEEYFLPIAENPRFLDAISEEASDMSDKEAPTSSRDIHHIKQCTPEQDLRQIPPPIPPRVHKRNVLGKYGHQVEQPSAILVETKMLTPQSIQGSVCSMQMAPLSEEKAEVVYLNDSNESSTSSGDFEDSVNEQEQETEMSDANEEQITNNNGPNEVGETESPYQSKETQPVEGIKVSNDLESTPNEVLEIKANESFTTTFSSHTSSCTKTDKFPDHKDISTTSVDTAVLSQLTPPPTPDDVTTKFSKRGSEKDTVLFDYTKIPNILASKEPDSGCKNPKGEAEEEGINILSNDSYVGVEQLVTDIKKPTYAEISGNNIGHHDYTVKNTDINHVVAVNMTKSTVNGHLDNLEFRKVTVDEVFKNGDSEVRKDFEEFRTNQNPKCLTGDHDFLNGCKEKFSVVNECYSEESKGNSKQGTGTAENQSNLTKGSTDGLKFSTECNSASSFNFLCNEDTTDGPFLTHTTVDDTKDTHMYKEHSSEKHTILQNNTLKEAVDQSFLRHVMMTSNDSNKTDNQKLKDFNNIQMLNSEIKDKISRKELIGPAFKKSKSPGDIDVVVLNCEECPGKSFVQRRVKEFSEECHDVEKHTTEESVLKHLVMPNGMSSESKKSLINKDLVKSRVKTFSDQEESVFNKNTDTGSVLFAILKNGTDKSGNVVTKGRGGTINKENKCLASEKLDQKEIIVPIAIETPNKNKNVQCKLNIDTIIPIQREEEELRNTNEESVLKHLVTSNVSTETEKSLLNQEVLKGRGKIFLDQEERVLNTSTDTGSVLFAILKNDEDKSDNVVTKNESGTLKEEIKCSALEKFGPKEIIIPIAIENPNINKNYKDKIENETIIPVQIEEQCFKLRETGTVEERLIPIVIENTADGDALPANRNLNILGNGRAAQDTSSVLKRILLEDSIEKNSSSILGKNESKEKKTEHKEHIVPIAIENINSDKKKNKEDLKKEMIIPVEIEGNTVEEKVIPISISKTNTNDNIKRTTSNKRYQEVTKSVEHVATSIGDGITAQNEILVPIAIKQTHQNQKELETKQEEIPEGKKKFIPIQIETEDVKSKTNINEMDSINNDVSHTTKVALKEVSSNLKSILENKKDEQNEDQDHSLPTASKFVKHEKTEPKILNIPINVATVDRLDLPPIPPPRRSKKNVTKKEYENMNMSQKNTKCDSNGQQNLKETEKKEPQEKIPLSSDITYTNVLSPPRPASAGSDSTDSEESSRCTAKYNPNSSIADVTSITKEEEAREDKQLYQPMSLRSIVLNLFMTLPFGEEILKELAEVSKSIDYITNKIPFRGLSGVNSDKSNDILAKREETMPRHCYTEKDVVRNQYGDERRKILELHEKFLTRRSYSEGDAGSTRGSDADRIIITGIDSRGMDVMSPNRLLTIIREEPNETDNATENIFFPDNTNQRLKAKDLGEWLTLARHKSKSTSNLDCTNIPINNLRKTFTDARSDYAKFSNTRRRSLPKEIYEKQLINIMEKEREIQRELEQLEEEKRKLRAEIAPSQQKEFQVDDFYVSKKGDFAEMRENVDKGPRPMSMPVFPTEFFRQQMYDEYMDKFSEREERKQQKVIKISTSNDLVEDPQNSLKSKEIIHPIEIEQEFMNKVKQKLQKHDEEQDGESSTSQLDDEVVEPFLDDKVPTDTPVIVLDGGKVKQIGTLPKHLQEFVDDLTAPPEESIWSPGQIRHPQSPPKSIQRTESQNSQTYGDEPISPIWTPKSANSSPTADRKEFRAVSFQSPVLSRKSRTNSETIRTPDSTSSEPPWKRPEGSSDTALNLSSSLDRRLPTSQSSPGFGSFSTTSRLPRAQNPTITLLQKAREGQLPRGAHYIDQDRRPPNDRPPIKYPGEILYHIKNEYTSESDSERPRKMADLAPRKFEGIGPTSRDGMPLILRSEVKDKDQSKWYKRMYDTIHKQKPHRDEFVTVRYKQKRAQYPYTSGYLSEPEPGAYDSDFTDYKYQTLDRRRMPQTQEYISNSYSTMPRSVPDKSYSSSNIIRDAPEKYQPGRIENYKPGHSSISEKEAKQWWDEVMDIFDGHLEQQNSRVPLQKPKSFINQALKESGYESDSTLVFRRKEDTANQLSPKEQRQAYKVIQKGGDVPFQGLRKPAPERPKEPDLPPPPPPPKSQGGVRSQEQESPRKYVENEVTIHYKTPVRTEIKEYVSEDELAHRQAETMKKIYEEERKRKYFQVSKSLQELQDMKSRRHTDNFIPSQKSPISLNRYDDFDDLNTPTKTRTRSPEPRLVARALYNFVGQTARELTFRKGDLIYVRRQVDKNWYEGELNAMVGLFPVNYVEIVPYEGPRTTPRKAHEGQARAKYNFLAQTHLELSLAKGELVTVTRRVDDNWFEGKIGGRKGIFPVGYVEVLIDPSDPPPPSTKPVASPAAHSLLLNGSAQGKDSMGSHLYTPNIPNPITARDTGYHHAKPVQLTGSGTYSTLPKAGSSSPIDQALHIETHSDPVPYRALYRYTPQNDDELELLEGDTVFVLEKCDDGWYVGSSDRTGAFGTFPGNYVEKI